jgi:hypothetical protein
MSLLDKLNALLDTFHRSSKDEKGEGAQRRGRESLEPPPLACGDFGVG